MRSTLDEQIWAVLELFRRLEIAYSMLQQSDWEEDEEAVAIVKGLHKDYGVDPDVVREEGLLQAFLDITPEVIVCAGLHSPRTPREFHILAIPDIPNVAIILRPAGYYYIEGWESGKRKIRFPDVSAFSKALFDFLAEIWQGEM